MRVLILGGGPTGLGAAWRLHALGHGDWELWERETTPGGLACSYVDEHGFTWDVGGHVQFSHYKTFDDVMNRALGPDGWLHHERESWVRIFGAWVPYPFQYNIHRLPLEQMQRCLAGLREAQRKRSDGRFRNFEELIFGCLGEGVADLFMLPYNFKVWAYPPHELGTEWIGERVALPDLNKIADSIATGRDNISWGPNRTFRFPKHGGTGAVWRSVAAQLPRDKLRLGRAAMRIDPRRRTVIAEDGTERHYDTLISSLPLDTLIEMAGLADLRGAMAQLRHSTVHIVGVGMHGKPGPELDRKCWMYFPEKNCPFYRVTVFSNYSPNNVPDIDRFWSLMAEVSESTQKPVDGKQLDEDVIQGMLNTGLIDRKEEVHHVWKRTIQHGYPTPVVGRDAVLHRVLPELERHGIYSRGRFGAWKYEVSNQDHSMMQGVEVVNRLLFGFPELTVWFPDLVNKMHPVYGKAWL